MTNERVILLTNERVILLTNERVILTTNERVILLTNERVILTAAKNYNNLNWWLTTRINCILVMTNLRDYPIIDSATLY